MQSRLYRNSRLIPRFGMSSCFDIESATTYRRFCRLAVEKYLKHSAHIHNRMMFLRWRGAGEPPLATRKDAAGKQRVSGDVEGSNRASVTTNRHT